MTISKVIPLALSLFISIINYTYAQESLEQAERYYQLADSLSGVYKPKEAIEYLEKARAIFGGFDKWGRYFDCEDLIIDNIRKDGKYDSALSRALPLLNEIQEKLGPNTPQEALHLLTLSKIYKGKGLGKRSLDFLENALNIGRRLDIGGEFWIDVYLIQMSINARGGHFPEAEKLVAKSERLIDSLKMGNTLLTSQVYHEVALVFHYQRKWTQAIDYYEKALHIKNSLFPNAPRPDIASIYSNLSIIYNGLGQDDKALIYVQKSIELLTDLYGPDSNRLSFAYTSLSDIYMRNGRLVKSLEYSNKALIFFKQLYGEHYTVLEQYINVAGNYRSTGNYEQASAIINLAEELSMKLYSENNQYLPSILFFKGELSETRKKPNEAELYYRQIIDIGENNDLFNLAILAASYNNLGQILAERKQLTEGLNYLEKAKELKVKFGGENNPELVSTLTGIGKIHMLNGDEEAGFQSMNLALTILRKNYPEKHIAFARTYNSIGGAYAGSDDYEKALKYYQKSFVSNIYDFHDSLTIGKIPQIIEAGTSRDVYITTLHCMAEAYDGMAQEEQVDVFVKIDSIYQVADSAISLARKTRFNNIDRIIFSESISKIASAAIQNSLRLYKINGSQEHLEQAFYYSEMNRANLLFNTFQNNKNQHSLPDSLRSKEDDLLTTITFYKSLILKSKSDSTKHIIQGKLTKAKAAYEALMGDIRRINPKYFRSRYQRMVPTVDEMLHQLPKDRTVIEYFEGENNFFVFILSTSGVQVLDIPKKEELGQTIEKFRTSITTQDFDVFIEKSSVLYQQIFAPVEPYLHSQKVTIIPDGTLWNVNFDLLLTDKVTTNDYKTLPYLIKRYSVSYAYSSQTLSEPNQLSAQNATKSVLAFSFGESSGLDVNQVRSFQNVRNSTSDLPGTREEITRIAELLEGDYYYGKAANEDNFKKSAPEYRILHLAIHGQVDDKTSENSFLQFMAGEDSLEDNNLHAFELYNMELNAELAVLSACDTGVGEVKKGEGIMSLGRAFAYAGVRSIMLSGWELSDGVAPDIMEGFYSELSKGADKSEALRAAKLNYLESSYASTSSPYYWGSLMIVGDDAPINLSGNKMWGYAAVILSIIFYLVVTVLILTEYRRQTTR
ncbi:MAG: CHAT domain-containing tetratricopeptide repeat protein [Bacteroidota bacterium]